MQTKAANYTISLKFGRISYNATHYTSIIEIIKPEAEMPFANIVKIRAKSSCVAKLKWGNCFLMPKERSEAHGHLNGEGWKPCVSD